MISRIAVIGFVFAAVAAVYPEARVCAQQDPLANLVAEGDDAFPQQTTTLRGWNERVRRALWNQSGGFGGRFYDRGLLRRNTYPMDHEYHLDIFTIHPSPKEETRFLDAANGFRATGGSLDYGRLAIETELKASIDIAESIGLEVSMVQQEDQNATRLVLVPSYIWKLTPNHRVGVRHSIMSVKTDIDVEAFYRYTNLERGIEAEVGVARLDMFNNFINHVLVPDPVHIDTIRVFDRVPYVASGRAKGPIWGPLFGEVVAGVQRESIEHVYLQSDSTDAFDFASTFRYFGALLEAEIIPGHLNAGGELRGTRTSVSRRSEEGSPNPSDYSASQSLLRYGVFANGRWSHIAAEGYLARELYQDGEWGSAFGGSVVDGPYDVGERWTWIKVRADGYLHENRLGPHAGVEYNAGLRSFRPESGEQEIQDRGVVRFRAWGGNHRLNFRFGYRFSKDASVSVGANYDLDGDPFFRDRRRFDGVMSRILVTW